MVRRGSPKPPAANVVNGFPSINDYDSAPGDGSLFLSSDRNSPVLSGMVNGEIVKVHGGVLIGNYKVENPTVPHNTPTRGIWTEQHIVPQRQDHPLNLTVPDKPTVAIDSILSVAWSGNLNDPVVNPWTVELDLDSDGVDPEIEGTFLASGEFGNQSGSGALFMRYFVPAGGSIAVTVEQSSGATTELYGYGIVVVEPV